jgi:predicted nuclease with TOPRIM domain
MTAMSDRSDMMLEMLRAIRADIGEMKANIAEIRHRLGLLEVGYATMQQRMDRMVGDIEQIRRRLDLVEA